MGRTKAKDLRRNRTRPVEGRGRAALPGLITIEKQDRVCEEANAVIGHQWLLNNRWVFSRLADVFDFITTQFSEE